MTQKKKKKSIQNKKSSQPMKKKKNTKTIKKKSAAKKKNVKKKNTSTKQPMSAKKKPSSSIVETKQEHMKKQNNSALLFIQKIWNTLCHFVKNKIVQFQEKRKTKHPKEHQPFVFSFKISSKTRKKIILISIVCLILAILLMFPFGITNYRSEASGKILDVPKFSKLSEECCMYSATFKSARSYLSLKMELNQIISQYEQLNCDGKDYYYNKEEDFTITDYGIKRGLILNEFYITYGHGNSCEIDTTLKNIELLPDAYSLNDAKRDGCYVVTDEVFNASSYDQFLENVEQKIPSTLRIATLTKEHDLILIDLKYLPDGKFKVIYDGTRDRTNPEDDRVIMAYKYEHIGIYKNKLYAYNGDHLSKEKIKTDDVYYLFAVK